MENPFIRTELLLGKKAMEKLNNSSVCIFGVGGVGSYCVEALVRSGIGSITVIDNDTISISNINRQLIALNSNIGEYKVDVIEKRIKDINPNCVVDKYKLFYLPETKDEIDFSKFDYIIDCIDTISAKIQIIEKAKENNKLVISSMGTGNKLDPQSFKVCDISKTDVDPLARVMRYELRKRNIKNVKVVYSTEKPIDIENKMINEETKKVVPASNAFVPASAGLLIAREVILDLINEEKE